MSGSIYIINTGADWSPVHESLKSIIKETFIHLFIVFCLCN